MKQIKWRELYWLAVSKWMQQTNYAQQSRYKKLIKYINKKMMRGIL